jgi:hypothetical protein
MGRVARLAAAIVFTGALAVISPTAASAAEATDPDAGVRCILCWPGW